jgi:hypothetical protein
MAQTVDNTGTYVSSGSTSTHSASITLGAGTNRRITVIAGQETGGGGYSGATFDGNAMTAIANATATHPSASDVKCAAWYYDVSDGAGTGSKTVTVTSSIATANLSWEAWQTTGSATGDPEYASAPSQTSASATISDTGVTVTAGSATLID